MESVDNWLRLIEADGVVVLRATVSGDWGCDTGVRDTPVFHFVAEGSCYLRLPGVAPLEICAGELLVLPRGDAHVMSRLPGSEVIPLSEFMQLHNGQVEHGGSRTTIMCGVFNLDRHIALPAIKALPTVLHLRSHGDGSESPIAKMLALLRTEVDSQGFGNDIIVRNLLSSLFVYFMRDWALGQEPGAANWFGAIRTTHTARALACIHDAPEKQWTLAQLAQEAGLSRAAFVRQFNDAVGEPPHIYLTRWRMGVAARLLENTTLRLADIARQVGYESESSFSRAFKQSRGVAPAHFKRSAY
jgi:AraC family transcriptional activator of mtrCDE